MRMRTEIQRLIYWVYRLMQKQIEELSSNTLIYFLYFSYGRMIIKLNIIYSR